VEQGGVLWRGCLPLEQVGSGCKGKSDRQCQEKTPVVLGQEVLGGGPIIRGLENGSHAALDGLVSKIHVRWGSSILVGHSKDEEQSCVSQCLCFLPGDWCGYPGGIPWVDLRKEVQGESSELRAGVAGSMKEEVCGQAPLLDLCVWCVPVGISRSGHPAH
jgi:hypothetical protein